MKFFLFLILFSQVAFAQLVHTVELNEKLEVVDEEAAKKELQHLASLKSIEKFAPEMGYKYDEFLEKLTKQFAAYFESYKERSAVEKFGPKYKETLGEAEKKAYFEALEKERHQAFIKYSKTLEIVRSHSITIQEHEPESTQWKAKVDLELDKIKLERLFRKTLNNESKPFSRIILHSEIDPYHFTWTDLGLDSEKGFLNPLNTSWLKWINENLPSNVEEVSGCDESCNDFYSKWSQSQADQITVPDEYKNSVLLKINIQLKRIEFVESLNESVFEWEGRAVLQDVNTKRILGSLALGTEKRTFRQLELKALNSALASSLYRTPMSALLQFNRKLEENIGFNRVSKLTIQGFRHLGDLQAYIELLKTRGSSLGLEVYLDSFTKEQAKLACFYRGEEKSFTDLLSAIKELKSNHSYTLVNEMTGVHNVIKFVAE